MDTLTIVALTMTTTATAASTTNTPITHHGHQRRHHDMFPYGGTVTVIIGPHPRRLRRTVGRICHWPHLVGALTHVLRDFNSHQEMVATPAGIGRGR